MKFTIQVPKPCNESWQEMMPTDNGRHCNQCSKTVVDFSGWGQDEVLSYIQQKGDEKVCGRFRNERRWRNRFGLFSSDDHVDQRRSGSRKVAAESVGVVDQRKPNFGILREGPRFLG